MLNPTMNNQGSGETSPRTSSAIYPLSLGAISFRYLILFLAGGLAMLIHARLKMHLGIPGHQGLLYMALMTGFCLNMRMPFGCLTFGAGSAALILSGIPGFGNPFMAIEYILVGMVADLVFKGGKRNAFGLGLIVLGGALSYGMIPLFRLLITSLTGYPYGSFIKHGFILSWISHMFFASLGAMAGLGIIRLAKKQHHDPESA